MSISIFKKYKNILGKQNEGVHKFKFLGTSMFDYLLTIGLAFLTTFLSKIPLVLTTIFWFIIGIILHILFGVETDVIKFFKIKV